MKKELYNNIYVGIAIGIFLTIFTMYLLPDTISVKDKYIYLINGCLIAYIIVDELKRRSKKGAIQ